MNEFQNNLNNGLGKVQDALTQSLSTDHHKQKKRMGTARAFTIFTEWFWAAINAILTGVFAFMVYFFSQYESIDHFAIQPYTRQAFTLFIALLWIIYALGVSDVARVLWNEGRFATGSAPEQQWTAFVMTCISFLASLLMSFLATRYITHFMGLIEIDLGRLYQTFVYTLLGLTTIHFSAAWVSSLFKPETRVLASAAKNESDAVNEMLEIYETVNAGALSALKADIHRFAPLARQRRFADLLNMGLGMIDYGDEKHIPDAIGLGQPQLLPAGLKTSKKSEGLTGKELKKAELSAPFGSVIVNGEIQFSNPEANYKTLLKVAENWKSTGAERVTFKVKTPMKMNGTDLNFFLLKGNGEIMGGLIEGKV